MDILSTVHRGRLRLGARAALALVAGVVACLAGVACGGGPESTVSVSLAVADRLNGTPSIAARGEVVAVAWSASLPDQGPDIYAAFSRDGGRTFGAPIKVNDDAAAARASGEQPPRIALSARGAAVVWVARRDGKSEVRVARSDSTFAAFSASRTVHAPDLPGARGWASLAADDLGRLRVVWLDGRSAEPRPAAHVHGSSAAAPPGAGSRPAAQPSSPAPAGPAARTAAASIRQDVFLATIDVDDRVTETLVADSVCFCCKTSVAITEAGAAAIAWRHIYPDNLRDMAVAVVAPGATTADVVRVSEDGWRINACPDDGPSLGTDEAGGLHVVWPTMVAGAEAQKAIFYASAPDTRTFSPRVRLDTGAGMAAHPSLAVASDGSLVAAWDEIGDARTRVLTRRLPRGAGSWTPVAVLSEHGTYPTVARTPTGVLAVWVDKTGPTPVIKIQ